MSYSLAPTVIMTEMALNYMRHYLDIKLTIQVGEGLTPNVSQWLFIIFKILNYVDVFIYVLPTHSQRIIACTQMQE